MKTNNVCIMWVGQHRIVVERKRVKHLNLRYRRRTRDFYASAPTWVSTRQIQEFLHTRHVWMDRVIAKQLHTATTLVSGDTTPRIFLWGVAYPLDHPTLCDVIKSKNKQQIEADVMELYTREVRTQGVRFLDQVSARMEVSYGRVAVRTMTSRWGSCNPRTGRICLNAHLARLPAQYLYYVVVHELAHLFYPNHGVAFWNLVRSYVDNLDELKAGLKQVDLSY